MSLNSVLKGIGRAVEGRFLLRRFQNQAKVLWKRHRNVCVSKGQGEGTDLDQWKLDKKKKSHLLFMDLFHNPQTKNSGIQRLECTELVKHIAFRVKQSKAKIPMLILPCYWTLGKYLCFFEKIKSGAWRNAAALWQFGGTTTLKKRCCWANQIHKICRILSETLLCQLYRTWKPYSKLSNNPSQNTTR